jgi:hypothetical protein
MTMFDISPDDVAGCQWPDHEPVTAYHYGCRCPRCQRAKSLDRYHRTKGIIPSCRFPGCEQPRRQVQGARYCEEHATSRYYGPTDAARTGYTTRTCALCGQDARIKKAKRYPLCGTCTQPAVNLINAATAHHVPLETLLRWLRNPQCETCDRPLYIGKSRGGAHGFAVDHDHDCCSGRSCGRCVRGLLCTSCNTGLGQLERAIRDASLDRLVAYLERARVEFS